MIPAPRYDSFDDLNAHLEQKCLARQNDRLRGHNQTIGERLISDLDALMGLPVAEYEACDHGTTRATSISMVRYTTIQMGTLRKHNISTTAELAQNGPCPSGPPQQCSFPKPAIHPTHRIFAKSLVSIGPIVSPLGSYKCYQRSGSNRNRCQKTKNRVKSTIGH